MQQHGQYSTSEWMEAVEPAGTDGATDGAAHPVATQYVRSGIAAAGVVAANTSGIHVGDCREQGEDDQGATRELLMLPLELLVNMAARLAISSLSQLSCTSRRVLTIVEGALRLRALERGLDSSVAPPEFMLTGEDASLVSLLWWDERRRASRAWTKTSIVAAGETHSVFVDDAGRLLVCGTEPDGLRGLLGADSPEPACSSFLLPTPVPSLSAVHIEAVAAGAFHTLALSQCGRIFSWGGDGNVLWASALGHGHTPDTAGSLRSRGPRVIESLQARGERMVAVAAGEGHSLALSAGGRAYSWGRGEDGRLGHPDLVSASATDDVHLPRLIDAVQGMQMCSVAAGAHHSVLIARTPMSDSSSNVWTFGLGYCLGRRAEGGGELEAEGTPRPICGFPDHEGIGQPIIILARASEYHTLLVDGEGRVFSCGLGGGGRLGLGHQQDSLMPQRVAGLLLGERVVSVAAGQGFSLAVTDEGCVFSWGSGMRGELGLLPLGEEDEANEEGEKECSIRLEPQLIERCDDGSVSWGGQRVVDVAAGKFHALALTAEGAVYGWGFAEDHQLGIELKDPEDELVETWAPMRISTLRCVRS